MILWYKFLLSSVGGYLVGAFPVGPLVARYAGVPNITEKGSKSAGATNVARHIGWYYFFLVLLLDTAKSYFYLGTISSLTNDSKSIVIASAALLVGNSYSIFLQGKGGKGVATSLGILLFLLPLSSVLYIALAWLLGLVVTRTIGIASCTAAFFLSILGLYKVVTQGPAPLFLFCVGMGVYVIVRHKHNILTFIAQYKTP